MHLWELCIEVRGNSLGGRAIQFAIGGDAIVVVGGGGGRRGCARRAGVCHTIKHANYKRWGWDRSLDLRMLFEGDQARLGHPLHVETKSKLGDCVLKIRCCICRSLISYHNSSWTCTATHIQSIMEVDIMVGSTPQVGQRTQLGAQNAVEAKQNIYYIIHDNRYICTPVYPTPRVQDNQPR